MPAHLHTAQCLDVGHIISPAATFPSLRVGTPLTHHTNHWQTSCQATSPTACSFPALFFCARQCRLLVLCCTECQGSCKSLPGIGTPRLDLTCELCQERQQGTAAGPHIQKKKQGRRRRRHGHSHTDVVILDLVSCQVLKPTSSSPETGPQLGCPGSIPGVFQLFTQLLALAQSCE